MPAKKKKKLILIIEDDQFIRKVYKFKLVKEGFDILVAKDGEEGLNMLLHNKPDLVLTDIMMPKMTGFDILEAMSNNKQLKGIKAIIMSNLGQESDIERGKKLGAVDYIVKADTDIQDVIKTINKHL